MQNIYCSELKSAKDRIHNLNIDLKKANEQVSSLENECESSYSRNEAMKQKNMSNIQEIKDLEKINK